MFQASALPTLRMNVERDNSLEGFLFFSRAFAAGAVAGIDGDAYGRAAGDCAGGGVDPAPAPGRCNYTVISFLRAARWAAVWLVRAGTPIFSSS